MAINQHPQHVMVRGAAKQAIWMSLHEIWRGRSEEDWEKVEVPLQEIAELWKGTDGPFLLDDEPSYADFAFVAFLQNWKRIGSGLYERLLETGSTFERLMEACEPWLERERVNFHAAS